MLVTKLITYYILWALRYGIPPWYYYQMNASFFNAKKGIYSKLDIDRLIPQKWRIPQYYLNNSVSPTQYPVFLKPEWGQNSYGIKVINNAVDYKNAQNTLAKTKIPYIVQEQANGHHEYELFYIQDPSDAEQHCCFTISETINTTDKTPINSTHNPNTQYKDLSDSFNKEELEKIKSHLKKLPNFRIARVALKAESKESLISGDFDIIEINLFAPMPLNLLDPKHSDQYKNAFIVKNMKQLALLSKNIPKTHFKPFVFCKTVLRHYQIKTPIFQLKAR